MGLNLDFTNVQGGDFEVLPKGTYTAAVFAIDQKYSNNGGNPYLNWQFKVQGGDHNGRIAFDTTSLQPQALWKLKSHLKAIAPDMDLSGSLDLDTDELLGNECRIVIEHEMYQGEPKARVKKVLPPDNSAGSADLPDFMK